jgi:rhodanese-related sulfurtransferase
LLALLLPLNAAAFTLSQAPVPNDPDAAHGDSAKLWPHVDLSEAHHLLARDGILFVDVRPHAAWASAHIPGAVSLPDAGLAGLSPKLESRLRGARALIFYGQGDGEEADRVSRALSDRGLRNLAVYSGGFAAWKAAKYFLEGQDVPKREHHALIGGQP